MKFWPRPKKALCRQIVTQSNYRYITVRNFKYKRISTMNCEQQKSSFYTYVIGFTSQDTTRIKRIKSYIVAPTIHRTSLSKRKNEFVGTEPRTDKERENSEQSSFISVANRH